MAYGNDPAQRMDVYLPANRSASSTPVLILIHGGAWISGDKSEFLPFSNISLVDSLRRRFAGYAIFNINYRLAGSGGANLYPSQESDVQTAVAFIYNKQNEYLVSDRFILLGASAGSNLAMLQGYKHTSPVKIKAVIDFFGPSDMPSFYQTTTAPIRTALQAYMGGTPETSPDNYNNASPLAFVTSQAPPTLILYGGNDIIVPPAQSQMLQSKLSQAGVAARVVYYPSEAHGWYGSSLSDSFDRIAEFLDSNK